MNNRPDSERRRSEHPDSTLPDSTLPDSSVSDLPSDPLRFQPIFKQAIWGGRRLGELLNKPIGADSDYAESWEIVDHNNDQSVVAEGPLKGQSLGDLYRDHRRWLMGKAWAARSISDAAITDTFPLLLKYLDCNRVLSVQVHPDDIYGANLTPPDLGKTEAWVILKSSPDSVIYAGLRPGIDRDALSEAIDQGRTVDVLHSFHPQAGDCVFIPAGTVHALGGGLLVAEIQQSSNTTFRLFDFNRTDASGQSRPLHIKESLEVTDYKRGPVEPIRSPTTSAIETLVQCEKFVLRRLQNADARVGGDDRCHLLSAIHGDAVVNTQSDSFVLKLGETILIPAASSSIEVQATHATVLWMTPPALN